MEIFLVEIDFSSIPSRDPEISFRFVKKFIGIYVFLVVVVVSFSISGLKLHGNLLS